MTAAVSLVERLAEALGRERDPDEHSPLCSDAEPCRYCMKLARALLPVVEQAVAEARGEVDGYRNLCRVQADLMAALRARVEAIHRPSTTHRAGYSPYCEGCWEAGGEDGAPTWPCPTIRALTDEEAP